VVHIAAGSWLIFWVFYDPSHWTKYLNIAPAFVWTILLLIKGFTAKPDDEAVKTMTRTGDRRELLKGPLFFTIVMNIMGTFFYYHPIAITSMGILAWGDGLAPVFGKRFGNHKFKILAEKSLEGSLAFLVFGFLGALIFNWLLIGEINFVLIAVLTVISGIAEMVSPSNSDNFIIPAVCIVIYFLL
jgi:dolichol kinase